MPRHGECVQDRHHGKTRIKREGSSAIMNTETCIEVTSGWNKRDMADTVSLFIIYCPFFLSRILFREESVTNLG